MKKSAVNSLALIFLLLFVSCAQEVKEQSELGSGLEEIPEKPEHTNNLIHETSPYLLQHAHNPVNWHPWNDETLEKAQKENKMVIISIGYAACHWCHVMEEESFSDPEVASIMNEHFISIKVDREERPDVDNVYMNAVQLMTGKGGWPLNVVALPDGKPFFAGTYFPKDDWMKILQYFVDRNENDPASLINEAEKITEGIHSLEDLPITENTEAFNIEDLAMFYQGLETNIDFEKGGHGEAPKFPMPVKWKFLLHYNHISGEKSALEAVTTTLDRMALGGIYDQLGGGFARYTVDADWQIPHFEKMLYDNAQLVELYSQAWQRTGNPLYKQIVYESLDFVARDLTSTEGAFYSSLDADTDGEEGKFYVWTASEIDEILGKDASVFKEYYQIEENGNWESGKNILHANSTIQDFARKKERKIQDIEEILTSSKSRLLEVRQKRTSPALDNKVLTSWNALMMKGYVSAYHAFGEEKFLEAAIKNAHFLIENAIAQDGSITRSYKDGRNTVPGFLDDYAFVISAFLDLYQATFDEKWLTRAKDLSAYTEEHFFDPSSKLFFYNHDEHSSLITRQKEIIDDVIPSSNSEMAKNLLFLGHYYYDREKTEMAEQMLATVDDNIKQSPSFYANWGILQAHIVQPPFEVAIVGTNYKEINKELQQHYLPNALLLGGEKGGSLELLKSKLIPGQTTIYVCKDFVCKYPVTTTKEALNQINEQSFW